MSESVNVDFSSRFQNRFTKQILFQEKPDFTNCFTDKYNIFVIILKGKMLIDRTK